MEISIDNWSNSRCNEEIYHVSSNQEILTILDKLDAKQHTLANLTFSESNYLMVGGGNGKYVITGEINGIIFNLINPNHQGTSKVALNTGGQLGLFEPKYIISKEIAFECALKYFSTGSIPENDEKYSWEKY